MSIIIGIDNGLRGGFAALTEKGDVLTLAITPVIKGRGLTYSEQGMIRLLTEVQAKANARQSRIIAWLEKAQPRPVKGALALMSTGIGYGLWRGMLAALQIPYAVIGAYHWQRQILADVNRKDTKRASITVAHRLFPNVNLKPTARCRKEHDGLSDALLIAEYGRRQENS